MGRPPLRPGTYGNISVRDSGASFVARTRYRRFDGHYQPVKASGPTATAARYALQERIAHGVEPQVRGDITGQTTLEALAETWLEEIRQQQKLAPQTVNLYADNVTRVVVPGLGELRIRELTVGNIDRFLKAQTAIAPSRARYARIVIGQMLDLAVRHDAIPRNPTEGTAPVPRSKKQIVSLDVEQIAAIRSAVRSWRTGPGVLGPKPDGQLGQIFDVILGTSGRIGETLAIRLLEDLDFSGDRLRVTISGTVVPYRSKGSGLVRQPYPKGSKEWQVITVPWFTEEAIRERIVVLRQRGEIGPDTTLFSTRKGTLQSPSNVRRQWRSIRTTIDPGVLGDFEFDKVTPHTFRKTVATTLAEAAEGGLELAREMLGHTSTKVTKDHYVQPRNRVNPITADILGGLVRRPSPPGGGLTL